ncbi:membrane integrity-associated transporter subunit PqiC [Paraburkholderia guartelaensis]|uniref:Membrane integrity-associated transporter subunit PqiC n=2 Tax=Paraburkholderia guartelaensis TaxID=2546446 RepID=A0A4R5LGM5_9BURK|nr:membrane integrity-associated transporter subunit PqiC [Paraburkholderia guartelaensis]
MTWLAGCSSPSPTFYALRSADDATAATSNASPAVPTGAAALDVIVGPVTVPDMVDRPQIVTRNPDNTIQMNEFARWATPLKLDVGRVVAADLAQRLGTAHVSTFDGASTPPVWRVRVDITRIDSVLGDSVTIDAQWVVRPPGHQALTLGHTVAHEQVTSQDYGALVDAHDRALATISADIAAAIRADHATVGSATE